MPECMTCSLANRTRFRRLPVYPFAAARISRRFFFAWTERFTRAMSSVPQQPTDRLRVRAGADLGRALDATASRGRLLRQHVVAGGLAVEHLALAGDAEPLGRGPVRLDLRHVGYPSSVSDAGTVATDSGDGAGAGSDSSSRAFSLACCSRNRRFGAITMIMFRPSCFGIDSTVTIPPRSPTNRSRIFLPSSVWVISRPRNMIVTLTLWPPRRNRSTCPFFVA